jgi:hypothetical protein
MMSMGPITTTHHTKFNVLTLSTPVARLFNEHPSAYKLRLADVTTSETGYSPQRRKPALSKETAMQEIMPHLDLYNPRRSILFAAEVKRPDHLAFISG